MERFRRPVVLVTAIGIVLSGVVAVGTFRFLFSCGSHESWGPDPMMTKEGITNLTGCHSRLLGLNGVDFDLSRPSNCTLNEFGPAPEGPSVPWAESEPQPGPVAYQFFAPAGHVHKRVRSTAIGFATYNVYCQPT